MEKRTYTIKFNHKVGQLAAYEVTKNGLDWVTNLAAETKEEAKAEFLRHDEWCRKEFIALGGKPEDFHETEVVFYAD